MSKAILGLLALVVIMPVIQPRGSHSAASTQAATTRRIELLIPKDDFPRFSASLDSVQTNDNGGITATVTLQNFSTRPYYFDDLALPRDIMGRIRFWRIDSEKSIEFGAEGCEYYGDFGTRSFKRLASGEKYTVSVEFGGNTGVLGGFRESSSEEPLLETSSVEIPSFKFLPVGRMAVTLQMELYVYSSNPASFLDQMQLEKWVVCQSGDLKWLTVTKTWA